MAKNTSAAPSARVTEAFSNRLQALQQLQREQADLERRLVAAQAEVERCQRDLEQSAYGVLLKKLSAARQRLDDCQNEVIVQRSPAAAFLRDNIPAELLRLERSIISEYTSGWREREGAGGEDFAAQSARKRLLKQALDRINELK